MANWPNPCPQKQPQTITPSVLHGICCMHWSLNLSPLLLRTISRPSPTCSLNLLSSEKITRSHISSVQFTCSRAHINHFFFFAVFKIGFWVDLRAYSYRNSGSAHMDKIVSDCWCSFKSMPFGIQAQEVVFDDCCLSRPAGSFLSFHAPSLSFFP